MKALKTLILVAAILAFSAGVAGAADETFADATQVLTTLTPPSSIEVTKDNDLSASVLSALLGGQTWRFAAGDAALDSMGGTGRYQGLVVILLGMFNLIAMVFVSAMVLYQWGIFAVQTAHEGKKLGGSTMSSLWIPVRQALAFTFVTPVLNGLSVLQVVVLFGVSFSINLGNTAWDTAGSYIAEHSGAGIVDTLPPAIEDESLNMISPMFQSAVISEMLKLRGNDEHINKNLQATDYPVGKRVSPSNFASIQLVGEDYVVVRQPLVGAITVFMMPGKRMDLSTLGAVIINGPIRSLDASGNLEAMSPTIRAHQMIAEARAAAVIRVWDRLREWARYYMREGAVPDEFAPNLDAPKPSMSGLEIAAEYREYVIEKTEAYSKALQAEYSTADMLEKAIGTRAGESQLGWISAGLFSVTLAHAQKSVDDMIYGGEAGVHPVYLQKVPFNRWTDTVQNAIKRAPGWAATELLAGRVLMSTDASGDGPGIISKLLGTIFMDSNGSQGLLATTLSKFRNTDPIIVLTNFGNKLYTLSGYLAGAIIGGGFLSIIPIVGDGLASIVQNPIVSTATIACFVVGFTLLVVAPWSIVIAWAYAVLYWIFRVVELLAAAPFWAAMHLAPEGAGLTGQHARRGYVMLIDLMCRPILLVFGACVAIAGWLIAGYLFTTMMSAFLNALTLSGGSSGGVVIEVATTAVVMLFFYALFLKFWLLCLDMPDRILRIIDSHGGHGGIAQDTAAVTGMAGAAVAKGAGMGGGALTEAGAAASKAGGSIRKAGAGMIEKMRGGKGETPANMAENKE